LTKDIRDTVLVRVLRDPNSKFADDLNNRLWQADDRSHKTGAGRIVLISIQDTRNFLASLAQAATLRPTLIIFDSPEQATAAPELRNLPRTDLCKPPLTCPAVIPPWVSGEQLEAAKIVLEQLTPKAEGKPAASK
jgi:hypothetical protein